MSKEKKIPQGDKVKLKFTLLISNIFISALCIFAIVGYFVMPLWKVETAITMTPELAAKMAPSSSDSGSSDSDGDDMMQEVIRSLGESGLKLSLSVNLDSSSFISAATGGDTKPFERIIENNVDNIMNSLSENIENAIAPLMKSVVVSVVKEQVKQAVKETLEAGEDLDEETKQALEELGINDEFIEENITSVIDALTDENATVESVSDAVMDVYDEVFGKIEDSSVYGKNVDEMTAEEKQQYEQDKAELRENIENSLNEVLEQIAGEDGSIDIDNILNKLLLAALEGSESENGGEESAAAGEVRAYSASVAYADGEASEEDAVEQIKQKIKAALLEQLNEESMQTIAKVMQIIGYVILFTFFTWAYLIIKILVKIGAKNPGIKLKLPIWLGWLPYLILVAIPNAFITAIKNGAADSVMGSGAEEAKVFLDAITIKFTSGSVFSFIAAIVLIVFSFFYGHYRRKLKRIIKYEKKNGIA